MTGRRWEAVWDVGVLVDLRQYRRRWLLGRCRAYEPRRSRKPGVLNESQSILDAGGQSVVRYDDSWCKLATIWTRTSASLMKYLISAVVVGHEER